MLEGLRRSGAQVSECHAGVWRGIQDRVNLASGGWLSPAFFGRALRAYAGLLWKYMRAGEYDVMVVGYPGQFDVYLGWLLARLRGKRLCWDTHMSIYLVALERGLQRKSRFTVGALCWIEKIACGLADQMILESDEYVQWFVETHGARREKFWQVTMGADEQRTPLMALPDPAARPDPFRVIYWGSFIQNHGVDVMLEAANLLRDEAGLAFEFVGSGPERERILERARALGLSNASFPGWVSDQELLRKIEGADLCLGVFGSTPQSLMTIQNKIHECLAMRKPLVSGRSGVIERGMRHAEELYLCEREPAALAAAIRALREQPALRAHIAEQGHAYFKEHFTIAAVGAQFYAGLRALAGQGKCAA